MYVNVLLTTPSTRLAYFTAATMCLLNSKSLEKVTPNYFSSVTSIIVVADPLWCMKY